MPTDHDLFGPRPVPPEPTHRELPVPIAEVPALVERTFHHRTRFLVQDVESERASLLRRRRFGTVPARVELRFRSTGTATASVAAESHFGGQLAVTLYRPGSTADVREVLDALAAACDDEGAPA